MNGLEKSITTPLKSNLKSTYSFRHTPTRQRGDGAYEKYFTGSFKIRDPRKELFIRKKLNRTASSDDIENAGDEYKPNDKTSESSDSLENEVITIDSSPEQPKRKSIIKITKPKTPTSVKRTTTTVSRRNTICRTPSVLTPSLKKRTQSKIKDKSQTNQYESARIKLHITNTPDCLPCRENQFSDIYTFIETNLKNQTGGCMYVAGVPGTGKTLTVRQVIVCLYECVWSKLLPNFRFIDINAFQVTEPHQIYRLIYKELTGECVSVEHAIMLLEKKFEQKSSESIVLLVDELDMLCTKKQDILYNLFDWPYKKNSKWIVIAIANAMNLPEQVMMNKISSRLGLTRMNFQPYTFNELQEIITCRLQELEIFESEAITFAARKVAAVSGDARRALEICRRATEYAEKESNLVTINHIDLAIRQMFSSAKITLIKNCTFYEQLFLKSIIILYQKTGLEETNLNKIIEQHTCMCKYESKKTLNRTQLLNICCLLASSKIILLEPSKNIYLQRVRLNMSVDDVEYALKN